MLGQFLRELFGRRSSRSATASSGTRPDVAADAKAPAIPARAVSVAPATSLAHATSPIAEGMPGGEPIAERLARDVRYRVDRLLVALDRGERGGDARDFLESLVTDFEAVVRHPPLAAQRALAVTRDPGASISRIVSLVEQDPGLGQALLRYANSAYYASSGGQVVSLVTAVNRVGTTGVHNVVLRVMVDGMLCRPGSAFQAHVNRTWEHMVRTAPIARALAAPFGVAPDEAYALGLLHDVGMLVIFDRLGELRASRRRELALSPALVAAIVQLLHEGVGGSAALQWGLGAMASEAIATHHRSPVPQGRSGRSELLFVAQHLATATAQQVEPSFEDWWRDGGLLTDRESVEEIARAFAAEGSELGLS